MTVGLEQLVLFVGKESSSKGTPLTAVPDGKKDAHSELLLSYNKIEGTPVGNAPERILHSFG